MLLTSFIYLKNSVDALYSAVEKNNGTNTEGLEILVVLHDKQSERTQEALPIRHFLGDFQIKRILHSAIIAFHNTELFS